MIRQCRANGDLDPLEDIRNQQPQGTVKDIEAQQLIERRVLPEEMLDPVTLKRDRVRRQPEVSQVLEATHCPLMVRDIQASTFELDGKVLDRQCWLCEDEVPTRTQRLAVLTCASIPRMQAPHPPS